MAIDKALYKDKRLTESEKKKIKPANQGGGPNYLGKQETVTVPKKWLSDPDHVVAELAYITPKEQKILLDANLYGSLKGKPNKGPGGIMSLQGDLGGYDASPGGPNSGGGGGNRVGQGDKNKQRVQDILRGNVTTGQTVAVSDRTRRGAVPEYAFGPGGKMKYIGSAYKSFGQPGLLDRIGGFFSGAPSGYRSVYNTRPGSGIFGTSFFGKPDITFNQGAGQYQFTDPRTGDVKPGIGGRILGGLASLITGVPFIGSMIGSAIDKYKPKSMYDDMSQYNRLGLFGVDPVLSDAYSDMKISDTSFSPSINVFPGIDFTNANAIRAMTQPTTYTNTPFEGARTVDTYRGVDPYKMNYLNRDLPTSYRSESLLDEQPQVPSADPEDYDFTGFEDAMAKLNKVEQRAYDTLKMGKELGMNTEEQNKQLEELEKKKNEASLITGLA